MGRIKKTKVADGVIEEIKRMLKDGDLKEGDKLPNQNEFAEQLGISRLSLREALHTLQMMGVIEQRPRVGTIIVSGNPELWPIQMLPPFFSDVKGTLELTEARRIIELETAQLAVTRINEFDIKKLEKLVQTMEEATENHDNNKYLNADIEFHTCIARASDNRYLISTFVTIFNLMDQFMRDYFDVLPMGIDNSLHMHKLILKSLKEKNPTKAVHYIRTHINEVESTLKNYYAMTD